MKDRDSFLAGIAASLKVSREAENGASSETNQAVISAMLMQFIIEKEMMGDLQEWITEGKFNFPSLK